MAPYETEEMAQAIVSTLDTSRTDLEALSVQADDRSHEWILTARLADGEVRSARFPYATDDGITTPRELAEAFARRVRER